jgi:hypothetical protein
MERIFETKTIIQILKQISGQTFTQIFRLVCVIFTLFFAFSGVVSAADTGVKPPLENCSGIKTDLTITALLKPSTFVPVIPNECSQDVAKNGNVTGAKALSLSAFPVILVRIYGLLSSLTFFLTGFNLIFVSIRYSYAAFDPGEATKALGSIQESATSLFLVLSAYIIINTIFSTIFKIPLKTDASDLQAFFN